MKRSLRFSGGLAAIAGVVGLAGSAFWATAASAGTLISVGYSVGGGPITTIYTSTNGVIAYSTTDLPGASGFSVSVNGNGTPATVGNDLLNTITTDLQTSSYVANGTTYALYITEQGISNSPLGFSNAYDVLSLSGASNVVLSTLYSASNALYTGTVTGSIGPVASATGNVFEGYSVGPASSSTYSLTEEYSGTVEATQATGNGSSIQADMDITATPLPATLPLLAGGLGVLGLLGRRKKQNLIVA